MQNNMVCMPFHFVQLLDTFFFDLFYVDTYTTGKITAKKKIQSEKLRTAPHSRNAAIIFYNL